MSQDIYLVCGELFKSEDNMFQKYWVLFVSLKRKRTKQISREKTQEKNVGTCTGVIQNTDLSSVLTSLQHVKITHLKWMEKKQQHNNVLYFF